MLNVKQLQAKVDSLDKLILRKSEKLNRYLEPYFNLPGDTIKVASNDVEARLEYLLDLKAQKRKDQDKEISPRDSIRRRRMAERQSNNAPVAAMVPTKVERNESLEKEDVLSRAIQNSKNIERITGNVIDSGKDNYELKAKYMVEWHRKYTLAVSCILLFFIGAPTWSYYKKGRIWFAIGGLHPTVHCLLCDQCVW